MKLSRMMETGCLVVYIFVFIFQKRFTNIRVYKYYRNIKDYLGSKNNNRRKYNKKVKNSNFFGLFIFDFCIIFLQKRTEDDATMEPGSPKIFSDKYIYIYINTLRLLYYSIDVITISLQVKIH